MAMPASSHAAANHQYEGAAAMPARAATARTDPAVITGRGPCRSISRPAGTPARAPVRLPAENAAVTAVADQPVAEVMSLPRTGNA